MIYSIFWVQSYGVFLKATIPKKEYFKYGAFLSVRVHAA